MINERIFNMPGRKEKFRARKTLKTKTSNYKKNGYAFSKRRTSALYRKPKPKFDYSSYFDYDSRGRIRGSYIDGRFIPD